MKRLLEVCLLTLTATSAITGSAAAQELQRGINVQMAVTSHPTPMPGADRADALIATVTSDGRVYLGIDPVAPEALTENIKASLTQPDQKLYIKADARAPYAEVLKVLEAVRGAGVASPILLTAPSEPATSTPGTIVPPQGWSVLVGTASAAAGATVLKLFDSPTHVPILMVNAQPVPWSDLPTALPQLLRQQRETMVLLSADGVTRFAQIARVVDVCRSTGAQVVLLVPSL